MGLSDDEYATPAGATKASPLDPVLKSDVRLLQYQVELLDKKLDRFFDEVKSNYASKNDLQGVRNDVTELKNNISWVIKIVLGAVVVAVVGMVIVKNGGGPLR